MTGILNIITARIENIDFASPLGVIDAMIAVILILGFLTFMRRYPAFRVVIGTLVLLGASFIFYALGFIMTALVFGVASNLILISLPLIFAPEIRHYLEKLGRFSFLRLPRITHSQKQSIFIRHLLDAVYELAERRIGGTVVIARRTGLGGTIETGTILDARFSSKLLQNLFFPKSPLHDGAVIVHDDRILAAGCLLPISGSVKLDPPFGTRHKSGLAITMDTDAVVLIVSEQRGEVTLAENGKLDVAIDRARLNERLKKML